MLLPPSLLLHALSPLVLALKAAAAAAVVARAMLWGCSCCLGMDSMGMGNDIGAPPKLVSGTGAPLTSPPPDPI